MHLTRSAACASCGGAVHVRAYYPAMAGGLLVGALLIALFLMFPNISVGSMLGVLIAASVLALAADYAMWRWLGFTPVPSAVEESPSTGATSRA